MIAITGATGLVGSRLTRELKGAGEEVCVISRRRDGDLDVARWVQWDVEGRELAGSDLEGVSAVVHLAGESIAGGRWTDAKKKRIVNSRVNGTRLVAETLAGMVEKPKVLVCASAIGWYGDSGEEPMSEDAPADDSFLGRTCEQWEAAADPAREAGIRVVHLRIGVVLDRAGGALAQMYWPFFLGVGGRVGDGKQWMSWVDLTDVTGVIRHALATESMVGPYNTVSPEPARNLAFTKTLGEVMGRPTIFPVPAFAARLVFGEMADALLLASTKVSAEKVQAAGYEFRHPDLKGSLERALG